MNATQIIDFWFAEIEPKSWWQKGEAFDRMIQERFQQTLETAKRGELFEWRSTAKGRLAEVMVLDQFSRNIYRDTPAAFAADSLALILAQEAVALGVDKSLSTIEAAFLYMPYMHSESLIIHEQALTLFSRKGLEDQYNFELKHKVIIERFGRYPHRNQILGRLSTPDEIEFLTQPGSSF